MSEVLCIFIWDRSEDVLTRSVMVDKSTKELKLNGKKPNKVIIPESCVDKRLLRRIDKICSYGCKKVVAKGR